jgi:hypothetical protein
MSAKSDAQAWAETVQAVGKKRGLRYEPVGGINPKGAPAALCPGGSNRLTGQLSQDFWGASCDADEREEGGLFSGGKAVLPRAVIAKAHVPDLAKVMPPFDVESIERNPEELVRQRAARKVEFESIEFNKRFLASVPKQYDPIALRETFSPAFLEWCTTMDRVVNFGVQEQQLYFHWTLRERSADEYELALKNGGSLFNRICAEVREANVHTYPPGPWHAGLEPFPDSPASAPAAS